ncbi:hypothetical protein Q3G72_012652 [Acer saccharum]|nr:hypothetical protein Q3G72_003711 [Acer saccharum]KAK1567476.1 hypothetical protein Q3G72_012652 [Acer saccharum]
MSILRKIPQDGTFDQPEPLRWLKGCMKSPGLSPDYKSNRFRAPNSAEGYFKFIRFTTVNPWASYHPGPYSHCVTTFLCGSVRMRSTLAGDLSNTSFSVMILSSGMREYINRFITG